MINSTLDYEIFKICSSNRQIDPKNVKRLQASLESRNLLAFKPIMVNKQMQVIDGQHRLEAAKGLKLPVFYEVCEDATPQDILCLNINQKNWNAADYLNYFKSLGFAEYIKLSNFLIEKKMSLKTALVLLTSHRGSEPYYVFKSGKFMFPDAEKLEDAFLSLARLNEVSEFIAEKALGSKKYLERTTFVYAFFKFISNPNVIHETFMKKLEYKVGLMRACTTASEYIMIFKEIYNWKNHDPIEITN